MKLARKFVSLLLLCFFAALATQSILRFYRGASTFEEGLRRDHRRMGRALGDAIATAWRTDGEKGAMALLQSVDEREDQIQLRWLWLNDVAGPPVSPVPQAAREALLRGEDTSIRVASPKGEPRLVTWIPVQLHDARQGVLEVSESLGALRKYEQESAIVSAVTAGGLTLLCAAVAILFGLRWVGRPLAALGNKARRIGAGDLTGELVLSPTDEIGELAAEFNRMCERLKESRDLAAAEAAGKLAATEQLRHADRLATAGRLASGLAHELGTPLNVVNARAKMIVSGEAQGAEVLENSRIIALQVEKMTRLIRQLLGVVRHRTPEKAEVEIQAIAKQTLEVLRPLAERQRVALVLAPGEQHWIRADGALVDQALTNLVVNAVQATPAGQSVTVAIARERLRPPADPGGKEAPYVRLSVRDEGPGMSEEVQHHLFEPFFTTKGVGEGTGLGLSVSSGIIREHGGWIAAESQLGRGSCFSIYLPDGKANEEPSPGGR